MLLTLVTMTTRSASAADEPARKGWWEHIRVLADDGLSGRETGSAGHRAAAEYVADQFRRAGLAPAGDSGFFQTVELESKEIDEPHSSLRLIRANQTETLELGRDAIIGLRGDPAPRVEAGLVFAGYGLSIPEAKYDDFAGLDLKGKVVVYLAGAPPSIPAPLAAHSQSGAERAAVLKSLGAIGAASIPNPKNMDIPWERSSLARFKPAMSLADPALDDSHGQKVSITVNPAHADKWLAGTGHTIAEILGLAERAGPLPHFEIPARLEAVVAVKRAKLASQNVLGFLAGTDPVLANEAVVFSAHLDHLGVGKPINGDPIFNGAMDNASGVASLIEVAQRLQSAGAKAKRSILFAAVTGEEKGLLGSRFLAHKNSTPPRTIVANINTDMFLPLFPFKMLTIFGIDESDLGRDAIAVARSLSVEPQADPEPKRNRFIRSDQYSFIRQGIPALALKVGYAAGSPEAAIVKKWTTDRYHAPSDDLAQPVDLKSADEFNALVARLLVRVADRPDRPRWNDESFFKRFAH
jgi:hypothetical protein